MPNNYVSSVSLNSFCFETKSTAFIEEILLIVKARHLIYEIKALGYFQPFEAYFIANLVFIDKGLI